MNIYIPFINTIVTNIIFLKEDFINVTISLGGITSFFIQFGLVIGLFLLFNLLGGKVRRNLFQLKETYIAPFIDTAIGYIFFGTGLYFIGVFGGFFSWVITIYIIGLSLFVLYPLRTLSMSIKRIQDLISYTSKNLQRNKIITLSILLFILIGFLRLIIPETNVDALWYHTDNPRKYNEMHTLMVKPNYQLHLVAIPQLNEMLYVVTDIYDAKHVSRYIHFGFYVLVVLLLVVYCQINKLSLFGPLLFVASPVTVRHMASSLSDFPWILCWFLAIYCCTNSIKTTRSVIALAGILFGGVLATKIWTIAFTPIFISFFLLSFRQKKVKERIVFSCIFLFFALLPSSIWYIRSLILTGNPVYPAFSRGEWFFPKTPGLSSYLSIEAIRFRIDSLKNFSPLLVFGIYSFIVSYKSTILKSFRKTKLFSFFLLVSIAYIVLPYYFGHYLYAWYVLLVIVFAAGLAKFLKANPKLAFLFYTLLTGLIVYYGVNTLLTLPYGFDWADKNKYLTRIISRDNSSYYDYGKRFSEKLSAGDTVAVYGMWGFYYADFNYQFVIDIFRKNDNSMHALSDSGINKLLIKGGDITWFCKKLHVDNCNQYEYTLLAKYTFSHAPASQYLYEIN